MERRLFVEARGAPELQGLYVWCDGEYQHEADEELRLVGSDVYVNETKLGSVDVAQAGQEHSGAWHSAVSDCGAACALALVRAGALGRQHWSCCHLLDRDDCPCPRSARARQQPVPRYFCPIFGGTRYSGHDGRGWPTYGGRPCYEWPPGTLARLHIAGSEVVLDVDESTKFELMLAAEAITGVPVWRQSGRLDSRSLRQLHVRSGAEHRVEECEAVAAGESGSVQSVLLVGGGPVGLWTALSLRVVLPDLRVTVCEKREVYQRSHALRISKQAFEGMGQHPTLARLAEEFYPRTRTATVEARLKEECVAAGVEFELAHVASWKEVSDRANLVLGCDGARSELRKQLCCGGGGDEGEEELAVDWTLGHGLLQVKFTAAGDVSGHRSTWELLRHNLKLESQLFQVLPGKPERGATPMTLFSLLLEPLRSANLRTAHAASLEQLYELLGPSPLCSDVRRIVEATAPHGVVAGSVKVSVLPAQVHVARRVASGSRLLLGDAAMGLPLEKGLGFGWRAANELVRRVAAMRGRFCASQIAASYAQWFRGLSGEACAAVDADYKAYMRRSQQGSWARSVANAGVGLRRRPGAAAAGTAAVMGQCAVCRKEGVALHEAGCWHSGHYHVAFGDCSAACVARLGLRHLGLQHFGCCGLVGRKEEACPESAHVVEVPERL